MDAEQRTRYSRHIQLPQIGEQGQARLLDSRVLIVGLGGLGSPVSMYLASSGVGHLVLADYDQVDLSNLQRQIVHATADVGRHKVESARTRLEALNPEIQISTHAYAFEEDDLAEQVRLADVVVDACDNFETRFAINAACVAAGTPLVSGAAQRMEGQVCVFVPADPDSPCYRCLYRDDLGDGEPCALTGVFAPLLGIVGSVQAAETLKILLGAGSSLAGRVMLIDAQHMDLRTLKLPRDPACPVCGEKGRLEPSH